MNFGHLIIISLAASALTSTSFGAESPCRIDVSFSNTHSEPTVLGQPGNERSDSVRPEGLVDLHPILSSLWAWMIEHSPYETPTTCPRIEFRSTAAFSEDICQSDTAHCAFGGFYRDGSGTIILRADHGHLDDVRARALLIHELTHYFQDQSGRWQDKNCRNWILREREANDVQRHFLVDNKGNPFGIGVHPMDETSCAEVIN